MLRFEDGKTVSVDDIRAFSEWAAQGGQNPREIAYRPARVLMQDFTGVPAVVDLAAMRDGIVALGRRPRQDQPAEPSRPRHRPFGDDRRIRQPARLPDERGPRIRAQHGALRVPQGGQNAFNNFRVVPPGTGICHQVNLEYLAKTVWSDKDQNGDEVAYPDTLVGTDSHTTMVNGAAVLGWGVGGIEGRGRDARRSPSPCSSRKS